MSYSQYNQPDAAHNMGYVYNGFPPTNSDWLYTGHQSVPDFSQQQQHQQPHQQPQQPLQEPGPFEEFQFSFGLDPSFAIPVPLDMPPMPMLPDEQMATDDAFQFNFTIPSQDISQLQNTSNNNSLLNEADQKAFSQFLDTFFSDASAAAEPLSNGIPLSEPPKYTMPQASEDDDEERRNMILRSLDERKRMPQPMAGLLGKTLEDNYCMAVDQQSSNGSAVSPDAMPWQADTPSPAPYRADAVYLHQSNAVTPPFIRPRQNSGRRSDEEYGKRTGADRSAASLVVSKRNKAHKELLTAEEKRANHIASEQKRRGTIRNGFKDLTDIIPTLKNINNSKSTVLFKAVEYMKYLEKRIKGLREKVAALEVRVQVENRLREGSELQRPTPQFPGDNRDTDNSSDASTLDKADTVAARAAAALRAHKAQQNNLLELQGQLQLHQKLIAQGGKVPYSRPTRPDDPTDYSDPYSTASSTPPTKGFRPVRHEDSNPRLGYPAVRQDTKKMEVDATEEPLKATVSA